MAVEPDPFHASEWHGARLSARMAAARARQAARRHGAVADLRLDDDVRLTDQIRIEVTARLHALVEAVARDLLQQAERLGVDAAVLPTPQAVVERLRRADLLTEPDLIAELVAQVRQALLSQALPIDSVAGDAPSLLVRLTEAPDRIVASAARAVLVAEGRARVAGQDGEAVAISPDLYHRMVWTVAAAMCPPEDGADTVLAKAAERLLAAYDPGGSPVAALLRLAAVIDARAAELPDLLVESLSDGQLGLFIALVAHAVRIDADVVRDLVVEPEGDQLWLVLRALDMDRATIARIGWALSEADPRRDVEGFADAVEPIMAIGADDARQAIASLSLPRPFRDAVERLEGFARR